MGRVLAVGVSVIIFVRERRIGNVGMVIVGTMVVVVGLSHRLFVPECTRADVTGWDQYMARCPATKRHEPGIGHQ